MTKPCTIKGLTLSALDLLEKAYISSRLDGFRSCPVRDPSSYALAVQHRELITFCKSHEVTGALVLANLVTQLAFERKIPTLLVTARCSPVIFVFNLLLWRAGIGLEEAVNPAWSKNEFARLTVAAREVASTPLVVMSSAIFAAFRRLILPAAANGRTYWVIMDAGTESFRQFEKVSCEPGVSITIVSFRRGGKEWTKAVEGANGKAETLVRSEQSCVSGGESPSSLEVRLPEFGTKVKNGRV